jgi:hypothetical protein
MRREIDYIEDDRTALRWAIGCVTASYAARLAALPRPRWQVSAAPVVAGSVLLLVAMALQGHASEDAPRPDVNEMTCDLRDVTPDIQSLQPLPSQDRGGLRRQAGASGAPCSRESRGTARISR